MLVLIRHWGNTLVRHQWLDVKTGCLFIQTVGAIFITLTSSQIANWPSNPSQDHDFVGERTNTGPPTRCNAVFSFFDVIITVHVVAQCQSNAGFLISSKGVYTRIKIHTVSLRISRSNFCTKMLPCEHG